MSALAPTTLPEASSSRDRDPAWEADNGLDNPRLADGDRVTLVHATLGDFSRGLFLVPAGTEGVVVCAKTARVWVRKGRKARYFANVDVEIEGVRGRCRVPHNALQKVRRKASP